MADKEGNNELPAAIDDNNIIFKKDDTNEKYFCCKNDGFIAKEGEKESIKRIAEMYFAKSGNKEDKKERNEEIKKKDEKLSDRHNKKLTKKILKEKKKAEKKQKASKIVPEKDDQQVTRPVKAAEEIEKSKKQPGCFAFIFACFGKRKEKVLQRSKSQSINKFDNEVVIERPCSGDSSDADDITGNGLEDVLKIEDIEIIVN